MSRKTPDYWGLVLLLVVVARIIDHISTHREPNKKREIFGWKENFWISTNLWNIISPLFKIYTMTTLTTVQGETFSVDPLDVQKVEYQFKCFCCILNTKLDIVVLFVLTYSVSVDGGDSVCLHPKTLNPLWKNGSTFICWLKQ